MFNYSWVNNIISHCWFWCNRLPAILSTSMSGNVFLTILFIAAKSIVAYLVSKTYALIIVMIGWSRLHYQKHWRYATAKPNIILLNRTLQTQYLFLLFDEANPLHRDDSNYVLTTEGHILFLEKDLLKPISAARRRMRREENHQCPVYEPVLTAYDWHTDTGLTQGIRSRADVDYARHLTGMNPEKIDTYLASPDGWCETPHVELFVSL